MRIPSLMRHIKVRPRLFVSLLLVVVMWLVLPSSIIQPTRIILSFDIGGSLFLGLTWAMMMRATPERMRLRSRLQDEGKTTILSLTVGAALFSVLAIALELHNIKALSPSATVWHVALAAFSIVCAWLVTHTMFALHYAHGYYGDGDGDPETVDDAKGLAFPDQTAHPDYWDFLYFAVVIGMTAQTSDVAITTRPMRRLAMAHGVLSFFFNTVILALSVNIAAGLL